MTTNDVRGSLDELGMSRTLIATILSKWKTREIFLILLASFVGALAAGAVMSMSWAAQVAHLIMFGVPLDVRLSANASVPIISALVFPTAGGVALTLLERFGRGHRVPSAADPVEANALRGGRLSLSGSMMMSGQTLLSNGCGASVGLEAGYVQIGAGIASWVGRHIGLRRNDLRLMVGCGAAGAIGAAFNAPLAGALYACELIIGAYSVRSAGPVLAASVSAALLTGQVGPHPYSLHVQVGEVRNALAQAIALSGVALITGVTGIGLMRAVAFLERAFKSLVPVLVRPAAGGLFVGVLAIYTPQVLAAGHGAVVLDLGLALSAKTLLILIFLKLLACTVSLASGFRGGLFFASLFLGVLIGKLYAVLLSTSLDPLGLGIDPVVSAVTGMAGLATAVIGAPLTMVLLVLEMTKSFDAAAAALPACLVTSIFVRASFGHSFATWRLHLKGQTIKSADDIGWLRDLTVGSIMARDFTAVSSEMTIGECRRIFLLGTHQTLFITDSGGTYRGVVLPIDLFADRQREKASKSVCVLARYANLALRANWNVKAAMRLFEEADAEVLAVTDAGGLILGFLTEKSARRRYIEELDNAMPGPMP